MSKNLIQLYHDIENIEPTEQVLEVKQEIIKMLNKQLKSNIFETVNLSEVVGFESVEDYLSRARQLIEMYKNK